MTITLVELYRLRYNSPFAMINPLLIVSTLPSKSMRYTNLSSFVIHISNLTPTNDFQVLGAFTSFLHIISKFYFDVDTSPIHVRISSGRIILTPQSLISDMFVFYIILIICQYFILNIFQMIFEHIAFHMLGC